MSFPVTLAAAVLKAPDAFSGSIDATTILIGIAAAGISSWLAIAVLLRFVTRYSFGVFAAYRLVLGVIVLVTVAARA
jgi:undecaprenyl-diphosphatase